MRIGTHQLPCIAVLAPMAGVTDAPFRRLCVDLGAGMAVSEMITSDVRLLGTAKTRRRLEHEGEREPRSVQIAGADPQRMAEAARLNAGLGAGIIDINMGCPAKKVCRVAAGSALLKDEGLVARILGAVVRAVDVPVTLKIRTGWDRTRRNAVAIARLAEGAGIAALAVHGRTRACGFHGSAEHETTRRIKEAVSIPVMVNGDIGGPEAARSVLEQTGADAVMIGRAAQGNPWIFREIQAALLDGRMHPPPTALETRDTLLGHLAALYRLYGRETGVRVARKHLSWYCRRWPGAERFWQAVNRIDDCERQLAVTRSFFDAEFDAAGDVPVGASVAQAA